MSTRRSKDIVIILGLSTILSINSYGIEQTEFRQSLKNLANSQQEVQKKLSKFGISSEPLNLFPDSADESRNDRSKEKKRTSLFTLHDDGKHRRAEAGKLLFGKVYNRLIVGGESIPATIALLPNQGLFSNLKVLGKARPSGTENRMAVDFDRVITRSGSVIPIRAYAEDESGAYGLDARVFSSKALAVAGSMVNSFISGLAASEQSQTTNSFGFTQIERTGRNALLQGVAQTAADQSKRLIEDATREKSVLVIEPDTPVTLYLDEEVKF